MTCPDIVFEVVNRDGTIIDASVFTYADLTQSLTTFTDDSLKVGVYPLTLQARYFGGQYPVAGTHDFTVEVLDPCIDQAIVTPQAQANLPDYLYTGLAPVLKKTLTPFVVSPPDFCVPTFSCAIISGPQFDLCSLNNGLTQSQFNSATG